MLPYIRFHRIDGSTCVNHPYVFPLLSVVDQFVEQTPDVDLHIFFLVSLPSKSSSFRCLFRGYIKEEAYVWPRETDFGLPRPVQRHGGIVLCSRIDHAGIVVSVYDHSNSVLDSFFNRGCCFPSVGREKQVYDMVFDLTRSAEICMYRMSDRSRSI